MTSDFRVELKDSITAKLVKVVFCFYLSIAAAVTLCHMFAEYHHMKNDVKENMKGIREIFEPALAVALWTLDSDQLESIAAGILKMPSIVGIEIQDTFGDTIIKKGLTLNTEGKLPELFNYRFSVFCLDTKEDNCESGIVVLFSSSHIVLERVRLIFLFILISATIKTLSLWIIFMGRSSTFEPSP